MLTREDFSGDIMNKVSHGGFWNNFMHALNPGRHAAVTKYRGKVLIHVGNYIIDALFMKVDEWENLNLYAIDTAKIVLLQENNNKQAISAREQALCQLTVCFEFQIRSDRRKGHKSCALEMVFRRKVRR